MSGPVKRSARVGGRLQEEIASAMRNLSDPRVQGALVSRVEVTDDLQTARVYVRLEVGGDDEAARKTLLRGLENASKRLRTATAQAMKLRYAPTLRFYYDEGPDAAGRIAELLREIASDRHKDEGGPEGAS